MTFFTNAGYKILKACVNQGEGMHPRIFCRRWFGLEDVLEDGRLRFTETQILAIESEHGYREKCVNLIAKILKIKPNTVQRWGKGVEFNNIPSDKRHQYETYLRYVDMLRVLSASLAKHDETLVIKLLNSSTKSELYNLKVSDKSEILV
ncbi:MAG: hypothetical protein RM338_11305 [Nostoc sp. DedQUE12a]|nr:hypothetical protein [Nostoc sp. DedQUE12a]